MLLGDCIQNIIAFFKLKEEMKVKGDTAANQSTLALEWLFMNENGLN